MHEQSLLNWMVMLYMGSTVNKIQQHYKAKRTIITAQDVLLSTPCLPLSQLQINAFACDGCSLC